MYVSRNAVSSRVHHRFPYRDGLATGTKWWIAAPILPVKRPAILSSSEQSVTSMISDFRSRNSRRMSAHGASRNEKRVIGGGAGGTSHWNVVSMAR